jgi:S-DNA-T family DNA segregation ATPase FtsK/SpoIIIE
LAQAKRKTETAPVSNHVANVLREAVLFILLAVAGYLLLALLSYHPADPGWSHTGLTGRVRNLAGALGAGLAQLGP